MAKGGGFYAVAVGRSAGIFTTWAQAEAQVKGYRGAKYKKFSTKGEASSFIAQHNGRAAPPVEPVAAASAPASPDFDAVAAAVGPTRPPNGKRKRAVDEEIDLTPPTQRPRESETTYYAVAKGHSTGIVTSFSEVLRLTNGLPGRPVYQAFDSKEAAEAYLAGFADSSALAASYPTALRPAATPQPTEAPSAAHSDEQEQKTTHSRDTSQTWYAVAKGRRTGVFSSWNEAKKQVQGLYSTCYKKFPTREEAEAFVEEHEEATSNVPGDPDPKDPETLVAFCDGSALGNGQRGCRAGFACIFPHCTEWNVAKKLVEPRATNNRAEYLAALEAIKRANIEDPSESRVLYIFSDSMLLIRSMTEWVATWQRNNWCKADGVPVLNRDLLERLIKEKGTRRVLWRHVKAHTRKTDWKSKWNNAADRAAKDAALSVDGEDTGS